MEDLPIDIHYNKLSDWLVKRRHCQQNWQDAALKIREKINNAIQDMPVHDGITKLLTGTYINYFHCLKILDILKETESSSKNIFGRYSSQRMKDWQEIVQLYQNDCVYLAEAAQMLTRNVNFEIPALKKQVTKCKKTQQDCTRKESDYNSMALEYRNKYQEACKNIGIEGKSIKRELLALASDLPKTYESVAGKCKDLTACLDHYNKFTSFINSSDAENCPLLKYICLKGNVTTYEWRTGQAPISVVATIGSPSSDIPDDKPENEDIDWGEINFGDEEDAAGDVIDFGEEPIEIEVADEGNADLTIDWDDSTTGDSNQAGKDTFSKSEDNIARGKDALTILDNPATRFQFIDELNELETFIEQRQIEQSAAGSDVILISLYQGAPDGVQMSDKELSLMLSIIRDITQDLTSPKMQQIMSIRNSPRFVDRLTENINKILDQSEKMAASSRLMIIKRDEALAEQVEAEPKIDLIRIKTKELKKQLEKEISKKYKDRIVNIMGEINTI